MREVKTLSQLGADEVIPEEYETSVEIFSRLLKKYLVSDEKIHAFTKEIRANGYSMLRRHSIDAKKDTFSLKDELPGLDVTSFKIEEGSSIHGSTLKDIDLRNIHGTTVLAIRRGEQIIENPTGNTQLLSGDMLTVLGKPEKLCQLRNFLEADFSGILSENCPYEEA